jgi:NAD(P)-dependent dehydrogenase (short-subunit alcohol dehydrogenase family)
MQKVVLVTGASSGIGAATVRALAQAGLRVFGGARKPANVVGATGAETVRLDVTNNDSVQAAVEEVTAKAGRIDVLVNNAGISLIGPVEATSDDEAQLVLNTNVLGVLRMSRAVLPGMRAAHAGLIVNVSSVLGFLPAPFMGLYAASKHAMEGLSETLDHEVRAFGVRVVLLEPSFTRTRLDTGAARTAAVIEAYKDALDRSQQAVGREIAAAPGPEAVAGKIVSIINGPHRLRQPTDGRARKLGLLRRFAPAKQMDAGLRKTFGL